MTLHSLEEAHKPKLSLSDFLKFSDIYSEGYGLDSCWFFFNQQIKAYSILTQKATV